jgi:hypothetical protein
MGDHFEVFIDRYPPQFTILVESNQQILEPVVLAWIVEFITQFFRCENQEFYTYKKYCNQKSLLQ